MRVTDDGKTRRRHWIGFLGAPVIWSVYFVLVYSLDEAACHLDLLAPRVVFPLVTVATVLALGLIATSLFLAYGAWRRGEGGGRGRFLGLTGLLMGALFLLMTLAIWVAAWVLAPC